jgi:hypothetical protein
MPNMNSGTERPYAPLLEPYIKLNFCNKWKVFNRLPFLLKFNFKQKINFSL